MDSAHAWRNSAVYGQFYESAAERAKELGYTLENFWMDPNKITNNRATQILLNRGITGLLLMPHTASHYRYELDWERFSVMRVADYTIEEPLSHCVVTDHYASIQTALEESHKRGYRRPALVTSRHIEERLYNSTLSAYLGAAAVQSKSWPDVLFADQLDKAEFDIWLRANQPDVLLTTYALGIYDKVIRFTYESGLNVPDELGLCMLCLPDHVFHRRTPADDDNKLSEISGIDERWDELARRSVELLVDIVERFERGIPEMPIRHLMKGMWHEGKTMRPRLEE